MLCGDGKEIQGGGDICIHMAGSVLHCTAETSATL